MNDERKQKVVKAAALIGQANDLLKGVLDEENAACNSLNAQDADSDYGFFLQMDIDDLSDILEELGDVQTAVVDMAERVSQKRKDIVREIDEADPRNLTSALGWDKDAMVRRLDYIKRFCGRLGIQVSYEMK